MCCWHASLLLLRSPVVRTRLEPHSPNHHHRRGPCWSKELPSLPPPLPNPAPILSPPLRGLFLYCVLSVSSFFFFLFFFLNYFCFFSSRTHRRRFTTTTTPPPLFICLVDRERMMMTGRRNIGHLCVRVFRGEDVGLLSDGEKCHEIFRFLSRE